MVVSEVKDLGRVMMALDSDWPTVVGNFSKARKQWAWMSWILGREGVDPPDFEKFIQGGGSIKYTVQNGVLGDDLSDREDPGWVPPQGGPQDEKKCSRRGPRQVSGSILH